ncbi:MAG TPA: thioredoxin domain-containing protein [Cyclobacteriaceae bacterium]|nr:thioredoxin domain-containing protein [Cyclobacteriaceae bacterium]
MSQNPGKPNRLANESSPYLLQHAYNPVDWYPWGREAHEKAASEDKPVIVSIGYSSCHWCHVMERESFESPEIAGLMNARFVCIKVDREERPDIDQVYMDAVQAMGVHGGWPLNVFLTPDLRPFYGGTYFRPDAWKQLLVNVSETYKRNKKEVRESADKFAEFIRESEIEKYSLHQTEEEFRLEEFAISIDKMIAGFDPAEGGFQRAPKFPMPVLWSFLLHYGFLVKNKTVVDHVGLTLKKMSEGGIFDQVGGGFSRYSVDGKWFVPHFEKMLYDNAQLLGLYAEAYRLNPDPAIRKVVYQTASFILREMTGNEGGFYSALDADSEGIEGKFYTWTDNEISQLLQDNAQIMKELWGITEKGNWEDSRNIIAVAADKEIICEKYDITGKDLESLTEKSRERLLVARSARIRPGLDNKLITAWNGMMVTGLANAYITFGDDFFLVPAIRNAGVLSGIFEELGKLPRKLQDPGNSTPGFLDDYAFVMEAMISLYQASFDEKWVGIALKIGNYVTQNFYDEKEDLFFYSPMDAETPVARKKELFDNVIPSSNSVMALNLFKLGKILDHAGFLEISGKMLSRMHKLIIAEPEYLSNWGKLFCLMSNPFAEIAVVGPDYNEICRDLLADFNPGKIVMGSGRESSLPLFEGRTAINGKTTIFVCYNKACKLPVHSVEEALRLLQ